MRWVEGPAWVRRGTQVDADRRPLPRAWRRHLHAGASDRGEPHPWLPAHQPRDGFAGLLRTGAASVRAARLRRVSTVRRVHGRSEQCVHVPGSHVTPDYRIDDHTLREVVDDQVAARSHVESLARLGPEGDHERVVWLRMLGELDAAERLGRAVLRRAGGATTTGGVASALRLAHVLHWRGRYRDADVLFDTARRTAERALAGREPTRRKWASAMIAFADQHQAKARFDEGRYDE